MLVRFVFKYLCITFCLVFITYVTGCGNDVNDETTTVDTGGAEFSLIWLDDDSEQRTAKAEGDSEMFCNGKGISIIRVDVYDGSLDKHLTDAIFLCEDREGTVYGIPSGKNRIFRLSGNDNEGNVIYEGETRGVEIVADKVISVGYIEMEFVKSGPTLTAGALIPADIAAFKENCVVMSPDGKRIYAIVNSPDRYNIAVIDTEMNEILTTIKISQDIRSLAIDGVGSRLYAISGDDNHDILVIDTEENSVVSEVKLAIPQNQASPKLAVVSGPVLYATTYGLEYSGIYAIDKESMEIIDTMDVSWKISYMGSIVLSKDKSQLYVLDGFNLKAISIIDLASFSVEGEILFENLVRGFVPGPDGRHLYVNFVDNYGIGLFDMEENNQIDKMIDVSSYGIVFSPDGSKLYTVGETGRISVIDTITRRLLTSFDMKNSRYSSVLISPDGSQLYILNSADGSLNVIEITE